MTLREAAQKLGMKPVSGHSRLSREVTRGYVSDLLSDVMANAGKGSVWITIQIHMNIIPVAVMKELAAIILANGKRPGPEVLAKAREERVPLLTSSLSSYEIACRLHEAGVPS